MFVIVTMVSLIRRMALMEWCIYICSLRRRCYELLMKRQIKSGDAKNKIKQNNNNNLLTD